MKKDFLFLGIASFILVIVLSNVSAFAQEPWRPDQLMQPADLANLINSSSPDKPIIFSIGVGAVIKGSVDIGPVEYQKNLDTFRKALEKLPKDSNIVIYCGCCPFVHCPNIRPAFRLLNEMKFTNQKLLNLSTSIKADWINKGYPVQSY